MGFRKNLSALVAFAAFFVGMTGAQSSVIDGPGPQALSWPAVEFAGSYRLEILDGSDHSVLDASGPETTRSFSLPAGTYRYRLTVINVLGKSEAVGPWTPLEIRKALRPLIAFFSPGVIYPGDPGAQLLVSGANLSGETLLFVRHAEGGPFIPVPAVPGPDGSLIADVSGLRPLSGIFLLRAQNPGGFFADAPSRVRFSKRFPAAVTVSAGWAPLVPVAGTWYTRVWNGTAYPGGVCLWADVTPAAKMTLRPGFRLSGSFLRAAGTPSGYRFFSDVRKISVDAFGSLSLLTPLTLSIGAGGGAAFSYVGVDYGQGTKTGISSINAVADVFAEMSYAVNDHLLLFLGATALDIFYLPVHAISVSPSLSAGWRF